MEREDKLLTFAEGLSWSVWLRGLVRSAKGLEV